MFARMPKLRAEEEDLEEVELFIEGRKELKHLRARRRADTIVIESGPPEESEPNARLRRLSVRRWILEFPTHKGRWEPTPYEDSIEALLVCLVESFPWTIAPV